VPKKPTIGELLPSGNGFEPAVGGKPNRNWTGPHPRYPVEYTSSHCRFVDLKEYGKQRTARLKSDNKKYKKGDDIHELGRRLKRHLEEYGLDPIMYANSPTDPNNMVCVLTGFDELQIKDVEKETMERKNSLWENYDTRNNLEVLYLLLNAVDSATATYLHLKDPNDDLPAVVLFLHLAKQGQVKLTMELYANKRAKVDGLHIKGTSGESVQFAQELVTANEWYSASTGHILKAFAAVSVILFAVKYEGMASDANPYLNSIRALPERKKRKLMAEQGYDPLDILDDGEQSTSTWWRKRSGPQPAT
jgi:hypothetical protein